MTKTTPLVSFGLYAISVKQDSSFACDDRQSFSKLADLKSDNASSLPYATYEPNFWLLDGGYKFKPVSDTTVHVGLMSNSMSNSAGVFSVAPVLTIDFSTVETTDGLTLRFSQYSNDYASSVQINYYDEALSLIRSDTYTLTSWELVIDQTVENFKQIVITFLGTNKPYRYLRLTGVDFGKLIYFTGTEIKSASVVEEIDPMSGQAIYNSFELELYSKNAQFSIIKPGSYYQYLQERQPIALYETVGNQTIFMGQYYTDKWENKSETNISFQCIDLLGILDTISYVGGMWSNANIEDVIESILSPVFIPYDLDINLYGKKITGWIPVCTYREAMQQIALACGAYLDCSRSSSLKIYSAPIASTSVASTTITKSMKGAEQKVSLKPLVTGVEVTAHNYYSITTSKTLFNGTLEVGDHTITFSEPMHNLSVSGATIVSSGVNYAVVNRASTPGTVTLTGQIYLDTQKKFSINTPNLPKGTKPNILQIKDATLINTTNAQTVAQKIYDYYQQRYKQKLRLYAPTNTQIGDVVEIESLYNQKLKAMVEKMSINLTGGFIADCELTGVVVEEGG